MCRMRPANGRFFAGWRSAPGDARRDGVAGCEIRRSLDVYTVNPTMIAKRIEYVSDRLPTAAVVSWNAHEWDLALAR